MPRRSTPEEPSPRDPADPLEPDRRWQRRAMERAMADARRRALERSTTFMAAAMGLLEETGAIDFTVQDVVERSGLSLRAFYQHFGSKDELLLALFEELLEQFVHDLRREIEDIDDPMARLDAYVRGFLKRSHGSLPVGGRAWTIYQLRLAVDRVDEYQHAVGPQIELLASVVAHGVARGAFRDDLPQATVTALLNAAVVSIAQMDVFHIRPADPIGADEVWDWCRAAVTPRAA